MNIKHVWYILFIFCTAWTSLVLISAPNSSYIDAHTGKSYWTVFAQLKNFGRKDGAPGKELAAGIDPMPVGQIKPAPGKIEEPPASETITFTHIKHHNIGKRIQLYQLVSASADKAILLREDKVVVATQDQSLPEAGRVLGLHKHDNEWVLITTDGYIDVWGRP